MTTRRAFTVPEVLAVVAVIVIILSILLPSLAKGRAHARTAICQSNLHEIDIQMRDLRASRLATRSTGSKLYFAALEWPGAPMSRGPDSRIFLCPEAEGLPSNDLSGVQFWASAFGGAPAFYVRFEAGEFCKVQPGSGYTDYRFEDWQNGDYDYNDAHIRIYDGPPKYGQITSANTGKNNDLYVGGQLLYADLRNHIGKTFDVPKGGTNYAINVKVNAPKVDGDTIVLLDYVETSANYGEDRGKLLKQSARHVGNLNYLDAGGATRLQKPTDLDPVFTTTAAELWIP